MQFTQRSVLVAIALFLVSLLSGCATMNNEQIARSEVYDPYETTNRKIHEFNKVIDRNLFRPASTGYVRIFPESMVLSFTNFSKNLALPSDAVDALLQGDLRTSGNAVVRFVINSTVGFAGLADPATDFQIPQVDTDFGETLYVWGFAEGPMLELPFYGPSTTRQSVGLIVNLFTSPLSFAPVRPVKNIGVYAELLERMGDRGNYSDTVDSILYESADSYAQAQIIYLQNRRFDLAGDNSEAYLDLYDDPYADIYGDPYAE